MKCFECNNKAEEDHHIIPKVNGGNKTIPLCSACHNKVHGMGGDRRDNHRENVMKGIDKHRDHKLWLVYGLLHQCDGDINDAKQLNQILNETKKSSCVTYISDSSFDSSMKRLMENDSEYWYDFFNSKGFFKRQFVSRFVFIR